MEIVRPQLAPVATEAAEEGAGAAGDLDAVYRTHARYVAAVVGRILGRDHEVDDVVQEVFVDAMAGLGRLREPEALRGWLATIAVRRAARRLKRRRFWRFFGLDEGGVSESLIAPGAAADDRVLVRRVYAFLDEVPVEQRIAWTLRHLEGEPLDVVAARCGCSLATAKRRIAAVQDAMEKVFDRE